MLPILASKQPGKEFFVLIESQAIDFNFPDSVIIPKFTHHQILLVLVHRLHKVPHFTRYCLVERYNFRRYWFIPRSIRFIMSTLLLCNESCSTLDHSKIFSSVKYDDL